MSDLQILCSNFRAAIVEYPPSRLPHPFKDFPHGACGDASYALAKFLGDHGFGTFDYVCGWKRIFNDEQFNEYSHAWLEKDGIIIDITGSQFNGRWPDVPDVADVVITTNRDFHKHFIEDKRYEADFLKVGSGDFYYAYSQIIKKL